MAISPPSDIVLDVARAAEPMDVEAARAALTKRAGGASVAFAVDADMGARPAGPPAGTDRGQEFKRFEAMVLQTFIQNMLPKDTEQVYGKGLAGDMWKSQLAERMADAMATRGGIGIAKSLLADHYRKGERTVPIGPVSGGPDKAALDLQTSLSTSLVHELQRKAANSMTGDETPVKTEVKI